ncbi:nuclear transport factor 2 family protein [Mycobacterium sp. DSM 3803]|nr:nuclear transport factor 2 family protein [Mycobacterium sp. DSM 3803]
MLTTHRLPARTFLLAACAVAVTVQFAISAHAEPSSADRTNGTANESVLDVLQRYNSAEVEYLENGNFAPVRAVFAPDAVVYQAAGLPYGGEHRGHAELEAALAGVRETWSEIEVLEANSVEDGPVAAVWERVRFVSRHTGRELTTEVFARVTVKDGLIVESRPFYLDTAAVQRAITP